MLRQTSLAAFRATWKAATTNKKSLFEIQLKCISCHRFVSNAAKPSSPENNSEVYYGVLTPQIRGIKIFSLTTSIAGVIAQPVLYTQIAGLGGGMPIMVAVGSFVGFFTFVTPFLLHFVTKKYVTKINYNPVEDKYSLTTLSFLLRPQTITFKPEDVEVPDIPGMFTSFNVKGKSVFVDSRLFPDPSHYIRIMGFDKPVDFKLGTPVHDEPLKKE